MSVIATTLDGAAVADDSAAVERTLSDSLAMLRARPDMAGPIAKTASMALGSLASASSGFPAPVRLGEWLATPMPKRPEIIHGLLRRGDKMTIGGSSKSKKTWFAAHLALCVSAGLPWLGHTTVKSPVTFVNLELPPDSFQERLLTLCDVLDFPLERADFRIWNLRGYKASVEAISDGLKNDPSPIGLLILDPLYKMLGDRVENDAGAMTDLMGILEAIALHHNCALVIPAHFSKGFQSEKSSLDRIAGSGVFARDADAITTLTDHVEEGCYSVESVLRSFPPTPPFVVRWNYPVFTRDADLDPSNLKKVAGRKPTVADDALLALLGRTGLTFTEWLNAADAKFSMPRSTFKDRVSQLRKGGKVLLPSSSGIYVPTR